MDAKKVGKSTSIEIQDKLANFVDTKGICKTCSQDHSFNPKLDDVTCSYFYFPIPFPKKNSDSVLGLEVKGLGWILCDSSVCRYVNKELIYHEVQFIMYLFICASPNA